MNVPFALSRASPPMIISVGATASASLRVFCVTVVMRVSNRLFKLVSGKDVNLGAAHRFELHPRVQLMGVRPFKCWARDLPPDVIVRTGGQVSERRCHNVLRNAMSARLSSAERLNPNSCPGTARLLDAIPFETGRHVVVS